MQHGMRQIDTKIYIDDDDDDDNEVIAKFVNVMCFECEYYVVIGTCWTASTSCTIPFTNMIIR